MKNIKKPACSTFRNPSRLNSPLTKVIIKQLSNFIIHLLKLIYYLYLQKKSECQKLKILLANPLSEKLDRESILCPRSIFSVIFFSRCFLHQFFYKDHMMVNISRNLSIHNLNYVKVLKIAAKLKFGYLSRCRGAIFPVFSLFFLH